MKRYKLLILACLLSPQTRAMTQPQEESLPPLADILQQEYGCSDTLVIRAQALTQTQLSQACQLMLQQERRFHRLLDTHDTPVPQDNNRRMRANVYHSRSDYERYVTAHFDVPSDNGGMYLEGHPEAPDNSAEFVTYERQGQIWNLAHEYVHYLDGRFNLYGDFCASLHDSHSAPEYCPDPAPLLPYLVWWSEGLAEYIAKGNDNPAALKLADEPGYALSALFNTGYEHNAGTERIYLWGYLAVRFMLERHKPRLYAMLAFTRKGDYPRYQALVTSWDDEMDDEFSLWRRQLNKKT